MACTVRVEPVRGALKRLEGGRVKRITALITSAIIASAVMYSDSAVAQPMSAGHVTYFKDGNELWRECGEATTGSPPASCINYIIGYADTEWLDASYDNKTLPYCLPDGALEGQITDVVRAYLSLHPEYRHFRAAQIVQDALIAAFPCSIAPDR